MNAGYKSSKFERTREEQTAIYTFARCEQLIADSARSAGIPESILAGHVAQLLLGQARGQVLGSEDHLSGMRGSSAYRGQVLEPVAVDVRSHNGTQAGSRLDEARALYKQGLSVNQIAETMQIHPHSARSYLVRVGIRRPDWNQKRGRPAGPAKFHRTPAKLSKRQQECTKLRNQGLTLTEIGKKLGITSGSVSTHLHYAEKKMEGK